MKATNFSFNLKYMSRKEMIKVIEKVTGRPKEEISVILWKEKRKRKRNTTVTVIVQY